MARQVGISSYHAALKPEEKLAFITEFDRNSSIGGGAASGALSGAGRGLLMMGDGINDAPALAAARVGVAVASTPSDMVAAAADVIVLNGRGAFSAVAWSGATHFS